MAPLSIVPTAQPVPAPPEDAARLASRAFLELAAFAFVQAVEGSPDSPYRKAREILGDDFDRISREVLARQCARVVADPVLASIAAAGRAGEGRLELDAAILEVVAETLREIGGEAWKRNALGIGAKP